MKEKENIRTLYLYEQNLLKTCTNKLLESSNEIVHDNILSIFDNIDEINRKLYNYLLKEELIVKERTTKRKKEDLYEELDCLLLRINE
ncbi:MAG: hypothetical protein IJL74_03850 [Bacilli bacterium]|nr:hypothetical protein [Bacilli bacterium]